MFKAIDRLGFFLKNCSISKQILAIIFVGCFVISLVPIVITCFYSVPVYDDYNFGLFTHKNVVSGDSFIAGIIETNNVFYNSWQGFFTSNILASSQPFNIDVDLYFISNLLAIFMLMTSLFYLCKTIIMNVLNFSLIDYLLITIPIVFFVMQFLPSISEGFYWMDGSLSSAVTGVLIYVYAFIINYINSYNKRIKFVYLLLSIFFMLIVCGSSILDLVTMFLLFSVAFVIMFINNIMGKNILFIIFSIHLTGIIIALIAPGNANRLASINGMPFVKSIILALTNSFTYFGKWLSLSYIVILLFISVIFYHYAKNMKFNFRYPLLVFIIGYLIYASRFSVQLYAMGHIGAHRYQNMYFVSFVIFTSITFLYFSGWLSKRGYSFEKIYSGTKISTIAVVIFAFLFGTSCFAKDIKDISLVSTGLSLVRGEVQQYKNEMMDRIELYENDNLKDVVVEPISVYPRCFVTESLTDDKDYWTNKSVAKYYNKDSVVLRDG